MERGSEAPRGRTRRYLAYFLAGATAATALTGFGMLGREYHHVFQEIKETGKVIREQQESLHMMESNLVELMACDFTVYMEKNMEKKLREAGHIPEEEMQSIFHNVFLRAYPRMLEGLEMRYKDINEIVCRAKEIYPQELEIELQLRGYPAIKI